MRPVENENSRPLRGDGGEHGPCLAEPVVRTRSMWFLCGRAGDEEPVRYVPIHSSPFVIGRGETCGLRLACHTVSSAHAELVDQGSAAVLRDLGSTNGTFVNGRRVTGAVELASGDLVQFATQVFRVLK
jgi:FHA domain